MSTRPEISPSVISFDMPLPKGYDLNDVLDFHGRDQFNVAEQVTPFGIRKGIIVDDYPTLVDISIDEKLTHATCSAFIDGDLRIDIQNQMQKICAGLLGLRLDPQNFSQFVAKDPLLGPLVKSQKNIRVVQSASVFEALTWAIMGQQLNVSFAVSLRRTFIQMADRRHTSGLWCYPTAKDVIKMDVDELRSKKFSKAKAETLIKLADMVESKKIDLAESHTNTIEKISAALLDIKGIGPWTTNYALLRGYAYADCSLHGDVAIRTAIHKLTGANERPDINNANEFLQQYSPHRTMVAAHLWASLSNKTSF